MHLKPGRGLIAAVLAGTLLVPAVGSVANPKNGLKETQKKLEKIRSDIAEGTQEARTLREKVVVLDRSLHRLQREVIGLDSKITEIESLVRDAQARIDETQKKIDRVTDAATKQAVALYKMGETETLDALLNSQSLSELDQQVEMLGRASSEKTGALVRFGRLQVEIRGQEEDLFDKKDMLTAALKEQSALLAEQQKQKANFASALAELREELGIKKSRELHFAEQEARIKGEIVEFQAKQAVASLGTSNKGFIWPMNGNVTSYYGPRWGRMHTGIDIDGYTGQPIVSVKEGRVILASYYSGYGNTVIVDHGGGYSTLYAHMSAFNVSNGAYVEQGKLLGYVGCTGSCTGDHLHFEVRVNGNPDDPMKYLP